HGQGGGTAPLVDDQRNVQTGGHLARDGSVDLVDSDLSGYQAGEAQIHRHTAQSYGGADDGRAQRIGRSGLTGIHGPLRTAQASGVDDDGVVGVNRVGRGDQLIVIGAQDGRQAGLRSRGTGAEDAGSRRVDDEVEVVADTAGGTQRHYRIAIDREGQLA